YIPRSQRPEWVAVGLLGKLLVRDDGTCEVNSYCKSNDEGIATKANQGYRVLERTGPNQVLVLVK
ncbi:peptidase G2 autoproteolytic cleavage domain-containing protein, partial [Bacillus subtilis]